MTDAPERIWACAGKRGGNRYWVGPGELYQAAHEVGPYVRADLHAAALAREAALREALQAIVDLTQKSGADFKKLHPKLNAALDAELQQHWPDVLGDFALAALGAQP